MNREEKIEKIGRRKFVIGALATLGAAAALSIEGEKAQAIETNPIETDPKDLQLLEKSLRDNYHLEAPTLAEHNVPFVPYFGEQGENIIDVANRVLAEGGDQAPKHAVYPRVVWGGTSTPERQSEELKTALMQGALEIGMVGSVQDEWSVLSYAGSNLENGAWFYPLTETTNNPDLIRKGRFEETVFDKGTERVSTPFAKLDSMMAVNIAFLENVGVRALPKVAGQLSFVLADGEVNGNVIAGFSMNPHFVENLTGGDPNSVPVIIVQGMTGSPVEVNYFNANGELTKTVQKYIEATNATISIEVPADGGFVTVGVPMRGDHNNANTELIMRSGTQPKQDIPGKNYVSRDILSSE